MEGHDLRQALIAMDFDFIKDVCSRLDKGWALVWLHKSWNYMREEAIEIEAKKEGTLAQFEEALKERGRGKRLVVIVAYGGTLYRFI